MMKGWFDAFRDDGGPTLYSFSNRTPVTFDVSIVAVSLLFATLYVAFLVIFPGVRKQVSSLQYTSIFYSLEEISLLQILTALIFFWSEETIAIFQTASIPQIDRCNHSITIIVTELIKLLIHHKIL